MLTLVLGKGVVLRWFPSAIVRFNDKIRENDHNLLFYMTFLRITPLLPNWSINIAAPICGVPLQTFVVATLVGLVPLNLILVNAGSTLATM
ncbi:MAG: VTT domain-containing protein [Kangiellaceae bacterium]|jgi:uncharacterized membrane protein YdjX (TVP38/TMEM64 family)|nr:VTT domain-containing protein [Kangiellaceae bacterium]